MTHPKRCARAAILAAVAAIAGCGGDSVAGAGETDTDPSTATDDGGPSGSDTEATTASGGMSESATDGEDLPPDPDFPDPGVLGPQGLRRQSLSELSATLAMILGLPDDETSERLEPLPADSRTPFDNDYRLQEPSLPLIEGMVSLAEGLAERITEDAAFRDQVLGCSPASETDEACLRHFIERFGKLALRRPLATDEVDDFARFIVAAQEDDDFDAAVALVVQAILLDAEFLYLIEVGEPTSDPAIVRLTDFEMASRLSFLLVGRAPDEALLNRTENGGLAGQSRLQETAGELLSSAQGVKQLQRMHAMWLSYDNLSLDPTLTASLRAETDALVARVLDEGSWTNLFTSHETYLDPELAAHYGVPLPGGAAGWVEYPDIRRGGLLSHGSFLAVGQTFSDTSFTERGKVVWTRLMCQDMPPPPPQVDTGLPPVGTGCKPDIYNMRLQPDCAGCHQIMDGIGMGLENYGTAGEWRTREAADPSCHIEGRGELPGQGEFAGAAALGSLLVETGQLEGCFMEHFYQFAMGRVAAQGDPTDDAMVDALTRKFEAQDDLVELIQTFVASDAFRHRMIEEVQ